MKIKLLNLLSIVGCLSMMTACSNDPMTDIGQGYESDSLYAPWDGLKNDTRFTCHASETKLYFNFEVTESDLILTDEFKGEKDVENEDRVELYFSPTKKLRKPYYCLEIDSKGRVLSYKAESYREFDNEWDFSTLVINVTTSGFGYRVCGNISLDELKELGMDLDEGFWMGVYQADFHKDGSVNWYSLIPSDDKKPDFHKSGYLFKCNMTPARKYRGVVVYPNDIISVGLKEWEKRIELAGLNLIGIHAATFNDPVDSLQKFVESKIGQDFLQMCSKMGVDVEYEIHALNYLLPRDLFAEHPEYFPEDEQGNRQQPYNMCFTSEKAVEVMRPQLESMLKWMKPTTHRYFLWTDDGQTACHCASCKEYSASEQTLIFEKRLLKMLREYDPDATLAHLAYHATITAPMKVRANEGIFLEFAPIRNSAKEQYLSPDAVSAYSDNLMAFPVHTHHVLEYWLDESLASQWHPDELVEFSDNYGQWTEEIKAYQDAGARSITTFATWLNKNYMDKYGSVDEIFRHYGVAFME